MYDSVLYLFTKLFVLLDTLRIWFSYKYLYRNDEGSEFVGYQNANLNLQEMDFQNYPMLEYGPEQFENTDEYNE